MNCFKEGDVIRMRHGYDSEFLSVGKSYIVIDIGYQDGNYINIINDIGDSVLYHYVAFELDLQLTRNVTIDGILS